MKTLKLKISNASYKLDEHVKAFIDGRFYVNEKRAVNICIETPSSLLGKIAYLSGERRSFFKKEQVLSKARMKKKQMELRAYKKANNIKDPAVVFRNTPRVLEFNEEYSNTDFYKLFKRLEENNFYASLDGFSSGFSTTRISMLNKANSELYSQCPVLFPVSLDFNENGTRSMNKDGVNFILKLAKERGYRLDAFEDFRLFIIKEYTENGSHKKIEFTNDLKKWSEKNIGKSIEENSLFDYENNTCPKIIEFLKSLQEAQGWFVFAYFQSWLKESKKEIGTFLGSSLKCADKGCYRGQAIARNFLVSYTIYVDVEDSIAEKILRSSALGNAGQFGTVECEIIEDSDSIDPDTVFTEDGIFGLNNLVLEQCFKIK